MKKVLSLITVLSMLLCFAGCGGYSTATDVVKAHFEAYNDNDYEAVLECYPEGARDYFVKSEGGEEGFETMVTTIHNYGTVVYEVVREEDVTDFSGIDASLEYIGRPFEYTAAKNVYLKTYIKHSDGSTTPENINELEETMAITVFVDGSWYIFDTLVYSEEITTEETE